MILSQRRWRIYFNRIEDAPQIWSIDEGFQESEINVQPVSISSPIETKCDLAAEYPAPKAWMECSVSLEIVNGTAFISKLAGSPPA